MDWKKAFTKNRVQITKNLANPNNVADSLFSDRVFTEEMRDAVQVRFFVTKILFCIFYETTGLHHDLKFTPVDIRGDKGS